MMTGSLLFNRQHSTTGVCSTKTKMSRPKLRRCSSADDYNSFEIISDDNNQNKEKLFTKYDPLSSDNDSGIEDFDQQPPINCSSLSPTDNANDEQEQLPSFGPCDDGDFQEYDHFQEQDIQNNLCLAAKVQHEEKKEFCKNTCEVFHGEFARLISIPISLHYPGIGYYLFAEDGVQGDPCQWNKFAYVKLDNAKAQFRCPNPKCRRLWTSMRARISFKISSPDPYGFVVLKVYRQNCSFCETSAEPLWYMEEVCRVMENLAKSIHDEFFPSNNNYLQNIQTNENSTKYSRHSRHDPHQRQGKMTAPHNKAHCEACQHGWCFN